MYSLTDHFAAVVVDVVDAAVVDDDAAGFAVVVVGRPDVAAGVVVGRPDVAVAVLNSSDMMINQISDSLYRLRSIAHLGTEKEE